MDLHTIDRGPNYNEILDQISTNLTNALSTFGPFSSQYQTILQILKDCLLAIDSDKKQNSGALDPDVLSLALGFLEIGK